MDGRVEQVDFQRNSFGIRDQSGEIVLVSLADTGRRSDVDRFRAVQSDVIARLDRAETIGIRSPSVVWKRNQDYLSGLIAYFEGIALEVYLLQIGRASCRERV